MVLPRPRVLHGISIHAPPAGSDMMSSRRVVLSPSISIHAPPAGSDSVIHNTKTVPRDFDPRSPCGERPELSYDGYIKTIISIHAPPAGSDYGTFVFVIDLFSFRSTLPLRGATTKISYDDYIKQNFDPRSPCGERHETDVMAQLDQLFRSTLPLRGATQVVSPTSFEDWISIHAPPAGSDPCS